MPVGMAVQFNVFKWIDVLISPHALPWHEATLVLLSGSVHPVPTVGIAKEWRDIVTQHHVSPWGWGPQFCPSSPRCRLSSPLSLPAWQRFKVQSHY